MSLIAKDTIFGQRPNEAERFIVNVEVGVPYQCDTDPEEWACPVAVKPLHQKLRDTHGDSSLQALCLSLSLAKSMLEHFLEEGGQLTYDNGEEYALEAVFGFTFKGRHAQQGVQPD